MVKKLLITAVGALGAYYVYRKVKAPVSAEEVLKGLEEELEKVLESVEETEEGEEENLPKYKKDIYIDGEKVATAYGLTQGIADAAEFLLYETTPEAEELIKEFKASMKDSMVGSE